MDVSDSKTRSDKPEGDVIKGDVINRGSGRVVPLWWTMFLVLLGANLIAAYYVWARQPETITEIVQLPADAAELETRDQLQVDNASIRGALDELRDVVGREQCEELSQPPRLDVARLRSHRGIDDAAAPGNAARTHDDARESTVAPDALPDQEQVASASEPLDRLTLVNRLEAATVFIVAPQAGGNHETGSGFIINDHSVITNRHVVENAAGGAVYVLNETLGQPISATVGQMSEGSEISRPDFAIVRLPGNHGDKALALSRHYGKLMPVLAAGFPGLSMQTDAKFLALVNGESNVAPELVVNKGEIQAVQTGPGGSELLLNSTDILQGNSGGPLVDSCGQVVGVSTFTAVEEKQGAKLSYALSTKALTRFLDSAGEPYTVASSNCSE